MATPVVEDSPQSAETEQKKTKRVFVVLNPVAGTTNPDAAKEAIEGYCKGQNWEYEIHETKKDEDLGKLVSDKLKAGVELVIAAGGDGTVSAVVAGMVNSQVPMAILPAGTGNALARDLTIPLGMGDALKLLGSDNTVREMDLMKVNGKKYYVMNVSVGLTAMVMHNTKREEKRRFGFLAYLYRAAGSVVRTRMHRFQFKVDDRAVSLRASEVMIANCKLLGLQPQLEGVEINSEDGRLDIFVVRANSVRDFLSVAVAFILRQKPGEAKTLRYLKANRTIQIQSDYPLPVQADGEEIGNTPTEIELIPKALRILVPCPPEKDKVEDSKTPAAS